jgi:hypothetical protein
MDSINKNLTPPNTENIELFKKKHSFVHFALKRVEVPKWVIEQSSRNRTIHIFS